jgi:hypothetical protein
MATEARPRVHVASLCHAATQRRHFGHWDAQAVPSRLVGQNWLACALGHKAFREGLSVLYQRASRLLPSGDRYSFGERIVRLDSMRSWHAHKHRSPTGNRAQPAQAAQLPSGWRHWV